jgi:hypothetical protein
VFVPEQKVGPFTVPAYPNSQIDLVYIDTDGIAKILYGVAAPSGSELVPSYSGKLVIAQVRLVNGDSNIPASRITDVRNFITTANPNLSLSCPRWRVKVHDAPNLTTPGQFLTGNILSTFSLPSLGSAFFPSDPYVLSGNSLLFEMKVSAISSITKALKLFALDDYLYCYLNNSLVFSRTSVYNSPSTPLNVAFNLISGENLVQLVYAEDGITERHLELFGDIIDFVNVNFMEI